MYDVKLKIWLVEDGRFIVSDGRASLLRKIKEHGSMSKAAREMGMSYRHAWDVLQRISRNAGGDIVSSTRGGKEGGVTRLTELGETVLREFDNKVDSLKSQLENSWRKPSVTADGIVVKGGKLLVIRRGKDPFKGDYALPGGFVEYGEKMEECVVREVKEETGLATQVVDLVGVYSDPDRDPRGHFVTAVYHLKPVGGRLKAGDDAKAAEWVRLTDLPNFAFDHGKIVRDFLRSRRSK
ncbi:TPA: NUDIX domain-containing protein [Thermoplasmata archaeon]|nr:NUDIX domain-containing protein [Thermoplasmata archaeon]